MNTAREFIRCSGVRRSPAQLGRNKFVDVPFWSTRNAPQINNRPQPGSRIPPFCLITRAVGPSCLKARRYGCAIVELNPSGWMIR